MKEQTIAELKAWAMVCLIAYSIGWVSFVLLIFLNYLDICWISENYHIFVVIWGIGQLFGADGIKTAFQINSLKKTT